MIDYNTATEFLFNQLPMFERTGADAYKPGLERVLALSERFGNPHSRLKSVIHVAGTNGKGSTAHTLAAILQSAGYRTGLFTSPHLVDFRERIRIDGKMIGKEAVCQFVDRFIGECADEIRPSFFELTTVMAFECFVEADVDVAVVEVGLGGRLDSTNIVMPDLCVITNISLDHTSLLGSTEPEIAGEKAGIIKPGAPVVIGEAECAVRDVFSRKAMECGSPIVFACDKNYVRDTHATESGYEYETEDYGTIHSALGGDCQPRNANTILAAVECLRKRGFDLPDNAVRKGFSEVVSLTGLAGRWMTLHDEPKVVCDTGHNPGGWQYLCRQIASLPGRVHVVAGFVNDKDVRTILRMMSESLTEAHLYFTEPSCHRKLYAADLADMASEYGLCGEVYPKVAEAYEKAFADCGKGDSIFVGGSNYVVAELLPLFKEQR